MNLSRPNALRFLQLLIVLLIRSAVNGCAISKNFLLVSLVTYQASHEEVCLHSFNGLNCWLNLAASYLYDEGNFLVLCLTFCSAIKSFNGSPHLGDICLLVQGLNKISQFLLLSLLDPK